MNDLNKTNAVRYSDGPRGTVLLDMYACGIGDDMHALPVVWGMVQDGFAVTINCKPFRNPIWQRAGAHVINKTELGLVWGVENAYKYERIISLTHWGGWECGELGYHTKNTTEQFAEIVGHRVPEYFDWHAVLDVKQSSGDYILYNPNSVEHWRTLPPESAQRVERELVMTGMRVERIGMESCSTIDELLEAVNNAAIVVSVEGGVSNIAGALKRPTVILAGMTDTGAVMDGFRAYTPELPVLEVRGATVYGCDAPCYRKPERGFENGKCCGVHDAPQCLARLDVDRVRNAVEAFTLTEV